MALAGAQLYVAQSGRHPVFRLGPGGTSPKVINLQRLKEASPGRMVGVLSEKPKAVTIAVHGEDLFLSHQVGRRVVRFSRRGAFKGTMPAPLKRPVDVAANSRAVYVADLERGEVIAWPRAGGKPRVIIRQAQPLALSVNEHQLAYVDRARSLAVRFDLRSQREISAMILPRVSIATRVSLSRSGWIAVVDREPGLGPSPVNMQLFNPENRLISWRHDPAFLARTLSIAGVTPVDLAWGPGRSRLRVLTRERVEITFHMPALFGNDAGSRDPGRKTQR